MNKIINSGTFAFLVMFLLFSSCTSEDNGAIDNTLIIKQIKEYATNGTWKITKYIDSEQNETADYNGFVFTFNVDGSLSASNGSENISGNWSVTDESNSTDDLDDDDDVDFNILFLSPANFEELSDDWDIISSTNTKIELIDISGGNGGTDYLTFEKI